MVMLANQSGKKARALAKRFVGSIGHLHSPGGQRGPFECFPYALDNGAFQAFKSGRRWESAAWLRLLDWSSRAERGPVPTPGDALGPGPSRAVPCVRPAQPYLDGSPLPAGLGAWEGYPALEEILGSLVGHAAVLLERKDKVMGMAVPWKEKR